MTDTEARIQNLERRIERLERLAFMGFQDTRDVAEYAYQQIHLEVPPEDIKRISWRQPSFHPLDDKEALSVGLAAHELVALKATMRILRKQTRLDVLGIVRDLVRRARRDTKLEEAA